MQIPVPVAISQKISERAVQLARESMKGYGWSNKSITAINAHASEGLVGLQTSTKYLMYQDKGIAPFIMWWVEGRRVPIKGRVVTGHGAGMPGYVYIPGRGRVWRDQKWRHPGMGPKYFMENAINQAIGEYRPAIQQMLLAALQVGPKK
jgi:hypothetical protein